MEEKSIFEVVVIATMSAGKSTVINALIGQELLHSANQATTATITRIHDKDGLPDFIGKAYSYQNELLFEQNVDADILKDWNANPQIKLIDLMGDIQGLHNDKAELVVYDTPGPNNSQDDNHEALTMQVIDDGHYGLILYVLNATQIGVHDDRSLLEKIKVALDKDSHKEIVFLLNKADCLDEEKGETIEKVVKNTQAYLLDIGFKEPIIIPTAAHYALVAEKVLNNVPLIRAERVVLDNALKSLNNKFITSAVVSNNLKLRVLKKLNKTRVSGKVKMPNGNTINKKLLKKSVFKTGFGVVQYLLQQKLSKSLHNLKISQKMNLKDSVHQETNHLNPNNISSDVLLETKKSQSFLIGAEAMSYQIHIEHNPFTIETNFKIRHSDDSLWQEPATNSSLTSYVNKRLQLWVENFFEEVDKNEFNEYGQFDVIFKGVEADYLDIQASAEKAKEKGIHVNLSWEKAEEPTARLENIKELMQEAKNNLIFAENINNSQEIQSNFEAALNRDFDVYVAATMSAGKSTFINAMLGCELLPNANEATTATIAQIVDNDTMPQGEFVGERYNKDGELVNEKQTVTLDTLKEWNALADTKLIKLEGNIIGVKERDDVRLVISDTPGPNNSQDRSHWETTQKYIQDSQRNPLILYILNGTQLGTNDDKNVLSMIGEIMRKGGKQSKDRFIFVVNKMDGFDFEKETTPEKVLENVRAYLKSNGIEEPQVYPVSALNAGLLRQRQNGKALTRNEQKSLNSWEYLCLPDGNYQGIDFVEYMPLTNSATTYLNTRKLLPTEYRTGIPAIEVMIDEYINKYNLPNRVNRAYTALKTAIEMSSTEQTLITSLNLNRDELEKVAEILSNLKNSETIKNNAKGKIDSLLNDDKSLYSASIIKEIDEQEASVRKMLREFSLQFNGKESKSVGQYKLNKLESDVYFEYNKLTNIFEHLVVETQQYVRTRLKEIFEEFNNELFEGQNFRELPLPVLDGLKHRMSSFEILLSSSEVKTRTETITEWAGTKTVKDSTWYKPWTWGNKRTVDVYEKRTITEEYVMLEELFLTREPEIRQQFDGLVRSAKEKIQIDTEKYLEQFKSFLAEVFDTAMKEILTDLTQKAQDKATLEAEIEIANQKLAEIQQFKQKLDRIIAL